VYDLLEPGGAEALPVRWDARRGFFVPGLSTATLRDVQDAFHVVRQGTHSRTVGSHQLNKDSSRSHSILTVHVESTSPQQGGHPVTRYGKVTFVDLAGSERLKQSGSTGEVQLKETGNINRSLFALGKVISALGQPLSNHQDPASTYIPYRDSKLTKLLMDSLGGSSLALMIATCSPAGRHVEETLSTLYYATSAKNIKNKPVVQLDPGEQIVVALRREITLLREENTMLREQLVAGGVEPGTASIYAELGGGRLSRGPASAPTVLRSTSVPSSSYSSPIQSPSKRRAYLDPLKPGGGESALALMNPEDIDDLSRSQLVKQLKQAHQLLAGYAERYCQLSEEHDELRFSKSTLESSFSEVLTDNERLEGKLEHLEAVFVTNEEGLEGSFRIGDEMSKIALDQTFPKVAAVHFTDSTRSIVKKNKK